MNIYNDTQASQFNKIKILFLIDYWTLLMKWLILIRNFFKNSIKILLRFWQDFDKSLFNEILINFCLKFRQNLNQSWFKISTRFESILNQYLDEISINLDSKLQQDLDQSWLKISTRFRSTLIQDFDKISINLTSRSRQDLDQS